MRRQGVVPNVVTYSALVSACEKGERLGQALKMFVAMQRQGVAPDVVTYCALISACEKSTHLDWALEALGTM